MHASRLPSSRLRALLVAILIAAMLCAHWQGLAHRIGHASRMMAVAELVDLAEPAAGALAGGETTIDGETGLRVLADHQGAGHSCLAFDAATVGACLGTAPFVLDLPVHTPVLAAWIAFISYQTPFTAHFSSRGPPQS
jgi:hypothetical protein